MAGRRLEIALVAALFAGGLAIRIAVTANHYVFAGSDSYGYLKLADELRTHGRYALGPEPEPLHFARPPLYPLFLVAVKRDARAEMSGGDGWARITHAQVFLDLLVTGLLVWWLARRLSGRVAGLIALTLAMFVPFTLLTVTAALTECLATALAVATVAPLILWSERPLRAFLAAGAGVGLSTLLRPDGILIAFALLPAVLMLPGWRARLKAAGLALVAFAVVFAPWPIRNQIRFGRTWAFGSRIDRTTRAVSNWEGPHHFFQSYGRDIDAFVWTAACMYDLRCAPSLARFEADGAVENAEERTRLAQLLEARAQKGLTPEVSRGFEELASAHRRSHPLRVFVGLPLWRALLLWCSPYDEIFQHPPLPGWYAVFRPALPALAMALFLALLLGATGAWLEKRTRPAGAILVAAIVGRTAVLAFTFYCLPRYVRQVMPLGYILIACGLVELARRGRAFMARRSA